MGRMKWILVAVVLAVVQACGGGGGGASAPAPVTPSITTQPSSATVNAGSGASFTVVASGTAPLTYQWRKDGTAISGATSSTHAIPSVQAADAGTYTVVVGNGTGWV